MTIVDNTVLYHGNSLREWNLSVLARENKIMNKEYIPTDLFFFHCFQDCFIFFSPQRSVNILLDLYLRISFSVAVFWCIVNGILPFVLQLFITGI